MRKITNETTVSPTLAEDVETLKKLREDYINCSKCVEETTKAQNYVNNLKSDKECLDDSINLK